jgi:hypothetical protein
MQKHLINSTAAYPGGISPGHRIFKVPTGIYAGRIVLLVQSSPSEIKLTYADYPYTSWSTPSNLINDMADYPFDALMDGNGNIYLAYTLGPTNDLTLRKLSFSAGNWTVGSLITVYNGDDNYFPSLCLESSNRLWVGWSRLSSGSYYVNAKYSDDWGANWVDGTSGPGEVLSSGAVSAYTKMVVMADYLYAIYSEGGAKINYRRKHIFATEWESEGEIFSGSGLDHNFDAAPSQDNRVGVVWDDGGIKFKEFDGNSWSGISVVDVDGGQFPQIKYINNLPYIVYISTVGSGQNNLLFSRRENNSFSSPVILDSAKSDFGKVYCYDISSAGFEDLTAAASSDTSGDIFHSGSSTIFKEIGDTLYLGLDEKYHFLKAIIATAGIGGTLTWQYFDGNEWVSFIPSGGSWFFTSTDKSLLLWDDILSTPENWQKCSVNGTEMFWIRITVASPFSTGPVGTRLTTVPNIQAVVLMER